MDSSTTLPGDLRVYRAMKEDQNGKPVVGATARTLGIRTGVDVAVVGGQVLPGHGGMSVSVGDPRNLPAHRRPTGFGGTGKDPVWEADVSVLGSDLQFVQDSPTHGTIQPTRPMSPDEFEKVLAATMDDWKKVKEDGT